MLVVLISWNEERVTIYDDIDKEWRFKIVEIFNKECDNLFLIGVASNEVMILKDEKVTIYNTQGNKIMESEVGEMRIEIV